MLFFFLVIVRAKDGVKISFASWQEELKLVKGKNYDHDLLFKHTDFFNFMFTLYFYTLPLDSGRVLWYHVGVHVSVYLSAHLPSIIHSSIHIFVFRR